MATIIKYFIYMSICGKRNKQRCHMFFAPLISMALLRLYISQKFQKWQLCSKKTAKQIIFLHTFLFDKQFLCFLKDYIWKRDCMLWMFLGFFHFKAVCEGTWGLEFQLNFVFKEIVLVIVEIHFTKPGKGRLQCLPKKGIQFTWWQCTNQMFDSIFLLKYF